MHLSEPGCRNNPVEVLETKSPMFIESYGYRPDTGGPGKHRGGVGVGRTYRFLAPSTGICLNYKTKTQPWSIGEGVAGTSNSVLLRPGTDQEESVGGSYNHFQAGERMVNKTGGGGGWGNPFEREPARVATDVEQGLVSLEKAASDYGVVLDATSLEIDEAATQRLRRERLSA